MTRDEETYFIRQMQVADQATIDEHFTLTEEKQIEDGIELRYDARSGKNKGFLMIQYSPSDDTLLAVEMDVGFETMLGLNRSPLELRILAEHMLALHKAAT